MLPAAHDGRLKALYSIGENPLVSDPDLNHAEDCLEHLELLVVQDLFMTETARKADVVLPSRCFAEKDGTFSNTERRVQRVRKAVDAPGDAWDDWKILTELAGRMGYAMDYADAEAIFEEIRRVTPSYAGITYQRIAQEGLHWPCLNEEHPGTPVLHSAQFTRGRGMFHAIDWQPAAELPDKEFPLYLTTGRILYQYHTGTMTMRCEDLMERAPESFVEISPQDAAAYGVVDGGRVSIASRRGGIEARAKVSRKAVTGTVFIPFHFAQGAANKLTNAALDPISGIPEYKVCAVKLAPAS
jgi:predicted molibdopterin-dependent oxidoreductase YjgC